jgi:hypothetical protein
MATKRGRGEDDWNANPFNGKFAQMQIPQLQGEDRHAICALTRAASVLLKGFTGAVSRLNPSARAEMLDGNEELLLRCEAVVGRFRDALGMTAEDMMDDASDDRLPSRV